MYIYIYYIYLYATEIQNEVGRFAESQKGDLDTVPDIHGSSTDHVMARARARNGWLVGN